MGRPKRKIRFSAAAEEVIGKVKEKDVKTANVNDPNSIWGRLSFKLFRKNEFHLRRKLLKKWRNMNPRAKHMFSSKNKSKHGRAYTMPFWTKRHSYQLGARRYGTKKAMRPKTSTNLQHVETDEDSDGAMVSEETEGKQMCSSNICIKRITDHYRTLILVSVREKH